jgi:hypothetical protein
VGELHGRTAEQERDCDGQPRGVGVMMPKRSAEPVQEVKSRLGPQPAARRPRTQQARLQQ